MTQEERLDLLVQVASGLAKLMGDEVEVVVHDLTRREVIFIANGMVTGRDKGYRINPAVYDVISNLADGEGHLIGYASRSANGKKLRSSHFMFTDEENVPVAMICINQDTSKMEGIIEYLEHGIRLRSMEPEEEREEHTLLDEDYILHVTKRAIIDSIEQMKPVDLNSKENKLELLRRLKFQGVFNVRDAVPYVCSVLSISQATLYNYLRELREEENEPINQIKMR